MCGLAGIIDFRVPGSVNEERVRVMRSALRQRGPDGEGIHLGSHAALAHTRLAVVDRTGGAQPVNSPDGRFTLICNGELYNYPELREEIGSRWEFRTRGDTEVVLAAYALWGRACLARLNGMFSFFLWDEVQQRGFGARDRLGIKPFWYRWHPQEFLFASEAKALLRAEDTRPTADVEGILEYLTAPCFSGVSRAMFAGIVPLPAGHSFEIDGEGLRIERWWDYVLEPQGPPDDPPLAQRLLELLEQATRRALRADEPPGLFLSGGVDSAALAALARRGGHRPRCFTIHFDDQEAFDYANSAIVGSDDLPHAVAAARALDLTCDVVPVSRSALGEDLRTLAGIDDALPAWEQELAQHHLARAASRHCKAVLVGDAADETHFGYHFLLDGQATRSPRGILERFAARFLRRDLLGDPLTHFTREYEEVCLAAGHSWRTPVGRLLATTYLIVKRWLARLLHNGDIHTMAFSLEARVPFGDADLLDFARRVPPSRAFANGNEKLLLRQALVGIVPETIRCRKKSALPKDQRAEEVYRREALRLAQEESTFLGAFLDVPSLIACCRRPTALTECERAALFRVICLAHWGRHHGVKTP
jgi:asparagine synthase (glutamine-hydrolysing)